MAIKGNFDNNTITINGETFGYFEIPREVWKNLNFFIERDIKEE